MNFRTLDLNLLRVFDVVMTERNVTRAAERLAMTQPAVSNALRRLREATGEELFRVAPHGVAPTPQAEALWRRTAHAVGELRQAFERRDFDPRVDRRGFSLAMADATAGVLAPALVAALPADAAIELRLLPLASRDPRTLLERGGADAAIGFFPELPATLATEGDGSAYTLAPLYACRYVCVLRRGHPLAARPRLEVADFAAARHVRVNFAGRPRGFVDDALAAHGAERHVVLTVDHFATAARVVHDSDLVGVLPASFVRASGLAPGLEVRELPLPMPRIDVGLVWHRRHAGDAGHRWLREWAAGVASSAGATSCPPPAVAAEATRVAVAA